MADPDDAEIDAARRTGDYDLVTRPRARAARYDAREARIVIDLVSGATFTFPARLAQGLSDASDADLAAVRIGGAGFGLHWEALDADFSVEGLLAGRFGTARYMIERFGPNWNAEAAA